MRRGLLLAALAALWAFAAWLLWRSSVAPDGLRLPHVDPAAEFPASELRRVERFDRFLRWNGVLSSVALLTTLVLYARRVVKPTRRPYLSGLRLGLTALTLAWIAQLPFRVASHWWQLRYGLAEGGYVAALLDRWPTLVAEVTLAGAAVLVVLGLARRLGERWWLAGGVFLVGAAVAATFLQPYLVTGTQPIRSAALRDTIAAYERHQGLSGVTVRVETVSDLTHAPNAFAYGFGRSARIVVWDTLLDGRYPGAEVRAVLAHELAHLSRRHVMKGLAWFALFALPGAWVLARSTRRRGGLGEPAAVPVALAVLVGLQLASLPLQSAVSRRIEAEADWVALQTTGDPSGAEALFREFTRVSLDDPSPPTWAYVLFSTHPTIEQRLAMARAFELRASR